MHKDLLENLRIMSEDQRLRKKSLAMMRWVVERLMESTPCA